MTRVKFFLGIIFLVIGFLRYENLFPVSYFLIVVAILVLLTNSSSIRLSKNFIYLAFFSFIMLIIRQFATDDFAGFWFSLYSFSIYIIVICVSSVISNRMSYFEFLSNCRIFIVILFGFDLFHSASSFDVSSGKSFGFYLHGVHEFGRLLVLLFFVEFIRNGSKLRLFDCMAVLILLVLAKARSEFLAVSIFCVIYYFDIFQFRRLLISRIFAVSLVSCFIILVPQIIIELKLALSDSILTESLKISSRFTDDSTSGRSWLWNHHMSLFYEYPFFGVGFDAVAFVKGDLINGLIAPAGSESVVTQFLAAFGLFSIFHAFPIIYVMVVSLIHSSVALISVSMLPLIVYLSLFGNPVSYWSLIFFLFLSTCVLFYEKNSDR